MITVMTHVWCMRHMLVHTKDVAEMVPPCDPQDHRALFWSPKPGDEREMIDAIEKKRRARA